MCCWKSRANWRGERLAARAGEKPKRGVIEGTHCLVLGQGKLVCCFGRPFGSAMLADEFRHQRQDRHTTGHGDPSAVDEEVVAGRKGDAWKSDTEILGMKRMYRRHRAGVCRTNHLREDDQEGIPEGDFQFSPASSVKRPRPQSGQISELAGSGGAVLPQSAETEWKVSGRVHERRIARAGTISKATLALLSRAIRGLIM